MSVLASAWTGIKSIFTTSPDKVLDMASGVGTWINDANFTEEEKSKANQKFLDFKLKWVNATQGQNLARRYCALIFGLNYIAAFQVCLWSLFANFVKNDAITGVVFVSSIVDLSVAFKLGWIMVAIISFYFVKEYIPERKQKPVE